jgi:hypothetical protein
MELHYNAISICYLGVFYMNIKEWMALFSALLRADVLNVVGKKVV